MLNNQNINLRLLQIEDAPMLLNWRFSQEAYSYFYEWNVNGEAQCEKWIANSLNKNNEMNFVIQTNDNIAIGIISLVDIDYRNRKCEMGRVLIGNKDFRGKKFGEQAIQLLLEYAFNHLNIRKVYCEVLSNNNVAENLYKKCGFVEDGFFKNHIYKNGKYIDVIHMAIENNKF